MADADVVKAVDDAIPASLPIAVFPLPVAQPSSASSPMAVFWEPVVFSSMASSPKASFSSPSTLFSSALRPWALLNSAAPVPSGSLLSSAKAPTALLKEAIWLFKSAAAPLLAKYLRSSVAPAGQKRHHNVSFLAVYSFLSRRVLPKILAICQGKTMQHETDAVGKFCKATPGLLWCVALQILFHALLIRLICRHAEDDEGRREGQGRAWICYLRFLLLF